MNHKKIRKSSKKRNLSHAKKKVKRGVANSDCVQDTMRACRRGYGEGLSK